MRSLSTTLSMTLDGVVQGLGREDEDTRGGFTHVAGVTGTRTKYWARRWPRAWLKPATCCSVAAASPPPQA